MHQSYIASAKTLEKVRKKSLISMNAARAELCLMECVHVRHTEMSMEESNLFLRNPSDLKLDVEQLLSLIHI